MDIFIRRLLDHALLVIVVIVLNGVDHMDLRLI